MIQGQWYTIFQPPCPPGTAALCADSLILPYLNFSYFSDPDDLLSQNSGLTQGPQVPTTPPQPKPPQKNGPTLGQEVARNAAIGGLIAGGVGCVIGAVPGIVGGTLFGGPPGGAAGGVAGCSEVGLPAALGGAILSVYGTLFYKAVFH